MLGLLGVLALPVFTAVPGVSAAARHASAPAQPANSAGQVYAWGLNSVGQLGDGTTNDSNTPVRVLLPDGVTATTIAAGNSHSLARTPAGQVYAWGGNNQGQLGDGNNDNSSTPVRVLLPSGVTAIALAAGNTHSLALPGNGNLQSWGSNHEGQLSAPPGVTPTARNVPGRVETPPGANSTAVAAGGNDTVSLSQGNHVYAWGSNTFGQLGRGTTGGFSATPEQVRLPDGQTATGIAAGFNFSLAVTRAGRVYAWGRNGNGQLGDGDTTDHNTPVLVHLPPGVTAAAVAAGFNFSLVLTPAGQVYAWGANYAGQLGIGTTSVVQTEPVRVHLPSAVTEVNAGAGNHTEALTQTGQVYSWGDNAFGQLGIGTTGGFRSTPVRVELPAGTRATAVADSFFHGMAVVQGGVGVTPAAPAAAVAPGAYTIGSTRFVVYTGTGGAVWVKQAGSPAAATSLGGRLVSAPSPVNAGGTRIVFGQGTDNALWQKTGNGPWTSLGGVLTSKPGAAVSGAPSAPSSSVYRVYVRGADGAVWARNHTAAGWGGWHPVGGAVLAGTGPSAATSGGSFFVDVVGTNQGLFIAQDGAGGFTSPFPLSTGRTSSSPALVNAPSSGSLVGFARGTDNAGWFYRFLPGQAGWQSMGGRLASGTGGSSTSGNWFAYGLGTDSQVWQHTGTGGATGSWTRVTP